MLSDNPALSGTDIKNPKQNFDQTRQPAERHLRLHRQGPQGVPGGHAAGSPSAAPTTRSARRRPGSRAARGHFAIVLDNEVSLAPIINFAENPDGIDGRTGAQISGGFTITEAQDLAKILQIGALPVKLEADLADSQVSATLGAAGARPGPQGRPRRLRPRRRSSCSSSTACSASSPSLALGVYGVYLLRADQADPDHADAAGDRGSDPHDRGRGRRQHRHLRAHKGGGARRADRCRARSPRATSKGSRRSSTPTSSRCSTAFILFVLATAGVKGFAFMLGVGTIVSLFTAVSSPRRCSAAEPLAPAALARRARRRRRKRSDGTSTSWARRSGSSRCPGVILLIGALAIGDQAAQLRHRLRVRHADQGGAGAADRRGRGARHARRGGLRRRGDPAVDNPELGQNVFQIQSDELEPERGRRGCSRRWTRQFGIAANGFDSTSDRADLRREVANSALIAIIVSLLVISVYIALRFEWKFAVPVLIALMHDILITGGVYALTGREVTSVDGRGVADHPRLLALRHDHRVRPHTRERAADAARRLLPDRQPLDERGPDALAGDQLLHPAAGRLAALLRRRRRCRTSPSR